MARARLLQRPAALTLALGVALVVSLALIEHRAGSAGAVDRALAGTFRWILPVVAFALSGLAADRKRLSDAAWPAARFGIAKRDVALGIVAAGIAASAAAGVILAALPVIAAHSAASLPLASDLFTSVRIGFLGGAAHGAWFAFGGTFGRRGGGRAWVLALHVVAGGSTGLAGAILANAHTQNLLGFAAPLDLPQAVSTAMLVLSTIVLSLAAALRCRD